LALPTYEELDSIASRTDFRPFAGKRVLITGASGLIGSYLAGTILAGTKLHGGQPVFLDLLVRNKTQPNLEPFLLEPTVRVIECNLQDWTPEESYDYLIHAASPASPTKYGDPSEIYSSNLGFLQRLSSFEMPKVTLLISSGEVYGPAAPVPIYEELRAENIPDSSRAAYPLAKMAAEDYLLSIPLDSGTRVQIARLFHTFGPGIRVDDGRSFADFIWAAASNQQIQMRSSGSAIRTFLYLEDAICGLLTVLHKGTNREIYNVGSTVETSIYEFASLVGKLGEVEIQVNNSSLGVEGYVSSPNHRIVPSVKKLELLGWSMRVDLKTAIRRTLKWAKSLK